MAANQGYRFAYPYLLSAWLFWPALGGSTTCGPIPLDNPIVGLKKLSLDKKAAYNGINFSQDACYDAIATDGGLAHTETDDAFALPPLDPEVFPSVDFGQQDSDAASINPGVYAKVKAQGGVTTTFAGGDYAIRQLEIGSDATARFAPGRYFVEELNVGDRARLEIAPAGPVEFLLKQRLQAGKLALFNPGGVVSHLRMFLYGEEDSKFGDDTVFNGVIHAPVTIHKLEIGQRSRFTGAVLSNSQVHLKQDVSILSSPATQTAVAAVSTCSPDPSGDCGPLPADYLVVALSKLKMEEGVQVEFVFNNDPNHAKSTRTVHDKYDCKTSNAVSPQGLLLELSPPPVFPDLYPPAFPDVDFGDTTTSSTLIEPGIYKEVKVEGNRTGTFAPGTYHIKKLEIKSGATVYLGRGEYFVEELKLDDNIALHVTPPGPARIYIKKKLETGKQGQLNPTGSPDQLQFFAYTSGDDLKFGEDSTISSTVYAPYLLKKVEIKDDTTFTGVVLSSGEVRLKDGVRFLYDAQSAAALSGLSSCPVGSQPPRPDHLRLLHPGVAPTCEPASITLQACADATCDQLYDSSVSVTLSPSGWVDGDTQTLHGSSNPRLSRTTTGTVTLGISAATPYPLNPVRCVGPSGTTDCRLSFVDSGLVFDLPDATPVACEPFTLGLRAVRADDTTQVCVVGIADTTKNVRFALTYADPNTGARPLTVAGVNLADGGDATIPVAFDSQGRGRLELAYGDAGLLTLGANYQGSGSDAGLELSGAIDLTVRPHGLAISAIADGVPLDNATSGGAPRWLAGRGFELTARAVCADGSLTPNYRPGAAALAVELAAPEADQGAIPGALTLGGQTLPGSFPGATAWTAINSLFQDGAVSDSQAAFSEVGTIRLQARDGDYFGAVIPALDPVTVGRFAPERFELATADPGELANACTGFTYLGQSFGYAADAQPTVTITPVNAVGAPVNNYREAFAKLQDPATQLSLAAAATTLGADGTTLIRLERSPGAATLSPNGDGSLTLTLGDDRFNYVKEPNARIAPFPATLSLSLTRVDDDDGTLAPTLLSLSPDPVEIRFGRLVLDSAQGSALDSLTLPLSAQYFDDGWRLNSLDGCTAYDGATMILGNYTGNLNPGESLPDGTGWLLGGRHDPAAPTALSAPGSGNHGSVAVTLPASDWLQDDTDSDGSYDDNPQATATFGLPRGSERVIFRRQLY